LKGFGKIEGVRFSIGERLATPDRGLKIGRFPGSAGRVEASSNALLQFL
jgi:hypothetical protein